MASSIRRLVKAITKLDRRTKIKIVSIIFILIMVCALNGIMTFFLKQASPFTAGRRPELEDYERICSHGNNPNHTISLCEALGF